MSARVIDGRAVAARVRAQVARDVAAFAAEHGRPPGLATVLVGDDPGSAVYVGGKQRASAEVGLRGFD
ncbi:MAG TPA: tetrahydrofolate dehydrogenase/cyclohydrolase catalytic domain-containing protein, partial [Solirubrobacteraceae bacterium]|nr:tetrahydrofolate dehydrogenase/cyclohydrolase catalytic domain-containing protein [Solirubrobacteraceae bacterium]